jgi:hypothetical protein
VTPTVPARHRATLWTLRVLLTAHLVAVLGQPLLAGLFLSGDVDAIRIHGLAGSLLAAFGLVLVAAALLHVTVGRGPLWLLPAAVALFLTEGVQVGLGYARELQWHVPLGVLVVTVAVVAAAWVWTPVAARPRRTARVAEVAAP